MPKVNYQRTEITALTPRWDLVRDCLSGELKIKDKGVKYLPKPNSAEVSTETDQRYDAYKTRAIFYNVTGRTLKGLVGQVFARDPVVTLPPDLELMIEDTDGAGVSLDQQTRKALGLVLAHGRAGILTDYPKTSGVATKEQLASGEIRPTITLYEPWDIINWRVASIGAKKYLSLVVISESEVCDDDGFEQQFDDYYRVLRLYEGTYWSEIWYFDQQLNDFVLEERVQPLDGAGQPWQEIPFKFIGAENNDPEPDLPPMYDMAVLNIGHYRNSADYEESCFLVGQPTPWLAGLTQEWIETAFEGKRIPLGSRSCIPLPEGASAGLLQAEQNIMPMEAMLHKEKQMVALGAKLVEQKQVQRTAMEAGMEEASTTSLLATCAKNVSQAYTCALAWAATYLGIENAEDEEGKEIDYELNTDFDIARLEPQAIAQVIASWQANAISEEEMRDNLRRGGIAYQSDEEWKDAIETAGLDLGMPVGSPASAAQAALDAAAAAKAAGTDPNAPVPAPGGKKPVPAKKGGKNKQPIKSGKPQKGKSS